MYANSGGGLDDRVFLLLMGVLSCFTERRLGDREKYANKCLKNIKNTVIQKKPPNLRIVPAKRYKANPKPRNNNAN